MLSLARFISKLMTLVSVTLMVLLCVPIIIEAVMRAIGQPTIWVFETTLYALIFLGFLGNAMAIKSGAHFRVTVLCQIFPQWRPALDVIAHVSTLVFAALIVAAGSYFVWYSWSQDILSATLLEVPMWIPQLAIPIGGLGLFLQTLVVLVSGEDPSAEHVIGD